MTQHYLLLDRKSGQIVRSIIGQQPYVYPALLRIPVSAPAQTHTV